MVENTQAGTASRRRQNIRKAKAKKKGGLTDYKQAFTVKTSGNSKVDECRQGSTS